jgi:endogenous inhibitor of DNA gyrase (YacG/DUF329 family)
LATTPQRSYTAPCPGCGAPVEFRSAQSTHAVCSFCHSTVVRDGDTLARIGKVAERFEDFSPLQLLARGTWQGHAFTLVGRLQYRGPDGAWTEWNCLFDAGPEAANGGTLAWLSEDNGGYVLAFPVTPGRELPEAARFRIGAVTAISGKSWQVTSNEQVALVAAEGELPKLPPLAAPFAMVELRSDDNEVLSLDYGEQPPTVSKGRPISLDELQFTGLKAGSEQAAKGRQFACPHCGAPVEPQFADSKAITCRSCHALIDLTQGIGGELRHALQDEPIQPLIPLGSTGQLQGAEWQVVGYQHRVGTEPGDDDEQFGWDEYLLYNAKRGFSFLVDAEDGWSMVKPTTGAPALSQDRRFATYLGQTYNLLYAYEAETTYVAGEFYWPVERGQKTFNRDFGKSGDLLSMEESPKEVTWSSGGKTSSDTVAAAFKLQDKPGMLKRGDAGPVSPRGGGGGWGCGSIVLLLIVILIALLVIRACTDNSRPSGYYGGGRTGGGSYGGYSGGGGHK